MADIFAALEKLGIYKKVLHAGVGDNPDYEDGTKTTKCDDERTVIDDSHRYDKPMEIILGKKFKLEVWEALLKTMRPKEVAEFTVDKKHLEQYALVSKQLREIFGKEKGEVKESHCCGMMAMSEQGLGHPDLDDLVKSPQPLIFTLEAINVERAGSFEKEVWTLSDEEKLGKLPRLRETGNELFKQKKYAQAADKYAEAIGILEQLSMKEKPGDPEWQELEDQKTPFLLNFAQCKLSLGDFYPVIEHTTTVLKRDADNVKALFRRAKAHVGAWNPEEARNDYERVAQLDSSLANTVKKELAHIDRLQKERNLEDKKKLQGLFINT
ncbi:AIP-like protein [Mya arenaria]|uniref:AIP-like protein n=1 Tax=Mya arenaria TaxID=6604 RepID=A0ABY7E446_MYAAR|nr:AIP-like protein [Mya arenaria]